MDKRMYENGPYRYITKHGIGPGTLPKDVKLVKWEDLDNYYTAIWTDRFLTTEELKEYEIYPEWIQDPKDLNTFKGWGKTNVFESLTNDDVEKLGGLNFTEEELSYLLSLFELISDEDKDVALGLVDAMFSGKKLVPDDKTVEESFTKNQRHKGYTAKLLGNVN